MKNINKNKTIIQQELLSLSPQPSQLPLSRIANTKKKITAINIAI